MIIKVDRIEQISTLPQQQKMLSIKTIEQELEVNPFGHYLLEVIEKKIIGFLYYSDIYERAEINQIEIDSSYRQCGKATRLLEEMIHLVRKNITLEVRKNNIPAIRLYKKFGFQEKAIRKGYYEGIDAILMEREEDTKK